MVVFKEFSCTTVQAMGKGTRSYKVSTPQKNVFHLFLRQGPDLEQVLADLGP
jgi:hypothetical protein